MKKESTPKSRPLTKGRVFTLVAEEVKDSPGLIHGKCFLKNTLLSALFDTGATHSFISEKCVDHLGLKLNLLPFDLSVSTPTEKSVLTSYACIDCSLILENKIFIVTLICLPLVNVDIILGMDWLSENNIVVDCFKKIIYFPGSHMVTQTEKGCPQLNAAQVEKSLLDGA